VNAIKGSIIALALAASWAPFNLWAQQSEAELLNQAHVTKHQAKKLHWLELSMALSRPSSFKKKAEC
jgi:hypothetical protein